MILHLFIYLLITMEMSAESVSCGPNGKCSCHVEGVMDCSSTFLPLEEVCDAVGNLTQKTISTLSFEHNGIHTINASDLTGCEHLSNLYVVGNDIYEISNSSFTLLKKLELLDLGNNTLNIYNNTLEQSQIFPTSLITLKLNGNFKENVTGNASYPDLHYLRYLKTLYIDGLQNQHFPENYRYMQKLESLILSGLNGYCNLSVVSNKTFENLINLRRLDISSCHIRNIHAGAFSKLSLLEILDLSLNMQLGFRPMRNISYSLQFTNIQELDISKLHTTFGIGTQMKKRDLCYLWNTTLRVLSVNSNRIMFFETNAFLLLPKSLNIVYTEDNKFTFTPYLLQFGCLSNLTELYGNRQNTAHKPIKFFHEPDILVPKYEPDNDDCPFMEDDFLRNISKLDADCPYFEPNKIIDYYLNVPRLPKNLKVLRMANCVLQYNVSGGFLYPPNNSLESIDASGNVLFAWHSTVGPFPKLKHLDLSKNYCSYLNSRATRALGSVENLQLQQNFLGLILADENEGSHIFENVTNLRTLNLSANIISFIPPPTFSNMTKLETLDLSVNNIDTWTIDVDNLQSLKDVNLRFNSIRSLPGSLRTKLEENMKRHGGSFRVDLRNNTIVCTCEEKAFLEWMVKYRHNMIGFNDYSFHDSSGTRISVDNFVAQVRNFDKACRSYVLLIVISSICVSVFLAIVIGGFIYKNRWKLRYLIRMAKIRHFGYNNLKNEFLHETYTYDAFISYASENLQFITNHLCPNLESQGLKLCLHERDFQPGKYVIDNILEAITNSKKTVVILSEAFLGSNWCMYEFNMARMDSIYSRGGSSNLLVVMYEELAYTKMSTEMLAWVKSNTYLEYSTNEQDQELFWKNLCDAIAE